MCLENSFHSYQWGKDHEVQLHDITFVPARDEITIDDFEPGASKEVTMHDGSLILLKKLDKDYDPTSRIEALKVLGKERVDENIIL